MKQPPVEAQQGENLDQTIPGAYPSHRVLFIGPAGNLECVISFPCVTFLIHLSQIITH